MAPGYIMRAKQTAPDAAGKSMGAPEFIKAMQETAASFEHDMTQALIPFIDSKFRTGPRSSPHGRAIDRRNADFLRHVQPA